MSQTKYYLINYTRKEFCFFNNKYTIFVIIETALRKNVHWKIEDEICIKSEGFSSIDYLNMMINTEQYIENPPLE
jgi:hypothetical protein